MTGDRVFQIGVLIGNVHTQHPMELIRGICEAARGENVNITFFVGAQGNALDFWEGGSDEDSLSAYNYQYNSLYDYSLIAGLDAIIISYGTLCIYLDRDDREAFAGKFRKVPLVILEEYDEKSCDSFIISDNYGSMYTIVEHLLTEHGYKRVLYLSGPRNNTDSNERERAYRDAMKAHGITVENGMVEYGDYSSEVDVLVERFLDAYPDAEAIACANDEMALSVYRVCRKRGILPGRDLAVTGYDDVEFAQRMDPPLTTADQDGLDMGYKALKCAISLCSDPKPVKLKLPARFLQRQSCGCRSLHSEVAESLEEILRRIQGAEDSKNTGTAVEWAARNSFQSIASEASLDRGRAYFDYLIKTLLEHLKCDVCDEKELITGARWEVQKLCEKEGEGALDFSGFTGCFHQIICHFMQEAMERHRMLLFEQIMEVTDNHVTSYIMRSSEDRINMLLNKSWTAPATILHMIENVENESAFYRLAVENTVAQGAKSSYLYLLPEPMRYDRNIQFNCPDKLELAAKYVDGEVTVFDKDSRPIVTKQEGFSKYYPNEPEHRYVTFMLFARAYQYGILICEIEPTSIGLLYGGALQISTAKAYMQISRLENETKQQLYATLKELKDKNQVLSFVSATDALTGLYNRRGFMEKAIEEVSAHKGSRAAVFFSDLDHLKQINDVFGHRDGDFALTSAASILKDVTMSFRRDGTVCGRTGGDEFVTLMILDRDEDAQEILRRLKEGCDAFNETSGKPFYVEFSTGCVHFPCDDNYSVPELIDKADSCLYEAKKKRRESVIKDENR